MAPTEPGGRPAPYERLYIYYIQGRLGSAGRPQHDGFIGAWAEEGDTFLFFSAPADQAVQDWLAGPPEAVLVDRYEMSYADWQGGRLECLTTPRLIIRTPWSPPGPAADSRPRLELDPGVVFGNGLHPTTRDCLAALERLAADRFPEAFLDLGTGTGILALAALRLGARRGLAVDLNLLAAETARANVRRNGLEGRLAVVQGRAEELVACPAELVIANLHFDALARVLEADGWPGKRVCLLSGLLRSEAPRVLERLASRGFELRERWVCDGVWHTFLGARPSR